MIRLPRLTKEQVVDYLARNVCRVGYVSTDKSDPNWGGIFSEIKNCWSVNVFPEFIIVTAREKEHETFLILKFGGQAEAV